MESETRGYVVRRFTKAEILDAIDFRGMIEGLLVRRIAERGPSRGFIAGAARVPGGGDEIFRKRCLVESDEVAYGQMNGRFHELISAAGGSSIFSGALERNAGIHLPAPMPSPSMPWIWRRCTTHCSSRTGSIIASSRPWKATRVRAPKY